jgi:hypothetical protein
VMDVLRDVRTDGAIRPPGRYNTHCENWHPSPDADRRVRDVLKVRIGAGTPPKKTHTRYEKISLR